MSEGHKGWNKKESQQRREKEIERKSKICLISMFTVNHTRMIICLKIKITKTYASQKLLVPHKATGKLGACTDRWHIY